MERAPRIADLFAAAREAGPYGDAPVSPAGFDPQVYVSRNDRVQPFHLICEHDTLLTTLAGTGVIEFRDASVLSQRVEPGDFVYVPGGTPHRINPQTPLVEVRLKALDAGLEATAWYCADCGSEIWRREFETDAEIPQEAYWDACADFNADEKRRTCPQCGAVHPPIDLTGFRWREIAESIKAPEQVPS